MLEIIPLPPAHWQLYRDLRLEALRTEPQAFGASYEENAQKPDDYWQGRLRETAEGVKSWLLFARAEDRLVGMIGAYAPDQTDTIELISMYVSPVVRGKGVANALMEALLEALGKTLRFRHVRLAVNVDQGPAIALYQRSGFQIEGEQMVRMGDGLMHRELVMGKALGLD
jgi:ribosomal protein S18 acetylase RimI-like enzyme